MATGSQLRKRDMDILYRVEQRDKSRETLKAIGADHGLSATRVRQIAERTRTFLDNFWKTDEERIEERQRQREAQAEQRNQEVVRERQRRYHAMGDSLADQVVPMGNCPSWQQLQTLGRWMEEHGALYPIGIAPIPIDMPFPKSLGNAPRDYIHPYYFNAGRILDAWMEGRANSVATMQRLLRLLEDGTLPPVLMAAS